ncbi:Required for respiratory growth protein 9 mitochondrial [Sticta canariensis]|nr:Required for respiratory growth protein 9 mitochondrial [Sticta canariensis]
MVRLILSKTSRHRFQSTFTPYLRSLPAASEHSNIFGIESSSEFDDVHIPFQGAVTKAKCHQHHLPDSKWIHASGPSYRKLQIELYDDGVPRLRRDSGTSQSYRLCSENSVHRSSREAVLGPRHKVSTATIDSRSEDHSSAKAFSDGKVAKKSIDVNRTRPRNLRLNLDSHGETNQDSSRINRIHSFNGRSKLESPVTSKNGMSLPEVPREPWQVQKRALLEKFGSSGWSPRKRLSPDALEGIRMLHSQSPDKYTTPVLADHFQVSPEVIRRILKSKWRPNEEEEAKRRERWDKRGESIWTQMVQIGIKPPKKWRDMGVGKTNIRSAGTSVRHKPSIKETLIAAMKSWDSDAATKVKRFISSPAPLSERIL